MRSTSCLGTIMRFHRPRMYMLRLQNKPRVRPHLSPSLKSLQSPTQSSFANTIHPKLVATPSTAPPKHGNSKTEAPSADLYPLSQHNSSAPVFLRILPRSRTMVVNPQQQQQQHQQKRELRLQLQRRRPRAVVRMCRQVIRMVRLWEWGQALLVRRLITGNRYFGLL